MIRLFRCLPAGLALLSVATAAEPPNDGFLPNDGAHGKGFHKVCLLGEWDGKKSVVARLDKGKDSFVLERVSKEQFLVKNSGTGEAYFKIDSTSPRFLWPGERMVLVDLVLKGESAYVLYCCNTGYFRARAMNRAPDTKPPFHWRAVHASSAPGWTLAEVMWIRDPYPENPGAENGIASAGLNPAGDVVFQLEDGKTDVFSFVGKEHAPFVNTEESKSYSTKNGSRFSIGGASMCFSPSLLWEPEELAWARETPEALTAKVNGWFFSKEEAIQWYLANFADKEAAEEIVEKIEKVHAK